MTFLQREIVNKMKEIDPEINVITDNWKRKDFQGEDGGGGITQSLEGKVFENAGVNTSENIRNACS